MTALPIPNLPLSSGTTIPQLGAGAYLVKPGEAVDVVGTALEVGYRHIDTASLYGNEVEVGEAIAKSGLARDEVFVTTKLWNTEQSRAADAFQESLDRLALDRVDLYLIHWPQPMYGEALGAWRSLIDIAESGRASAIGVSNFEVSDLRQLIDETGVVPAVNQIELHPLHQRRELVEYCSEHGIVVEAWGPLAQGKSDLFEREELLEIARAHDKSAAQVVLRWHVQQGRVVFPKTVRRARLIENADIFDFALTDGELATIDAFEAETNFGPDPRTFDKR